MSSLVYRRALVKGAFSVALQHGLTYIIAKRGNEPTLRILITGGKGFLGSHLGVRLQELGHDVLSMDDLSHACEMPVDFDNEEASVLDKKTVTKKVLWADFVFHLAAIINVDEANDSPLQAAKVNILGTMNVLQACSKFDKPCIVASSSEVYGTDLNPGGMSEAHPLNPQGPYAASKCAADRMAYSFHKTFGTKVIILRNFNTFGPYQRTDSYGGVIAKFCKAGSQGKALEIYGDGTQTRDYMWVDDAIDAYMILFAMQKSIYGEVFNAGTGHEVSVNTIASLIAKHYNVPTRHVPSRKGEVMRLNADSTKIQRLGWKPTTTFHDKLQDYMTWFDTQ